MAKIHIFAFQMDTAMKSNLTHKGFVRGWACILVAVFWLSSCGVSRPGVSAAGGTVPTYFTMDEMPDLIACLPPPPDPGTPAFSYDSTRYVWGKEQRLDEVRAKMADRDAVWILDSVFTTFNEPFGMELSPSETPEIWMLLMTGLTTTDLIRVRPKAHFHRIRPFEYFGEHMYTLWEEDGLRGEGSYPSGHTIRAWCTALILSEINPAAANRIYARAWECGISRVIVGAHWQSDVDASRVAASIAYAKLQTSPAFRTRMERAKREFRRHLRFKR